MSNEDIGTILCIFCASILVCNLAFAIFAERLERK